MIPEVILTALFVGWILNGKFGRLADVKIRYPWMIFVPLGLAVGGTVLNYSHAIPGNSWFFGMVWILELSILSVVVFANKQLPGAKLMLGGLIINLMPMIANGGRMPVKYDALLAITGKAQLAANLHAYPFVRDMFITAATRLPLLCDVLPVKRPFVLMPSVYSIGDIVTSIGGFIVILAIMRTPLAHERTFIVEEA